MSGYQSLSADSLRDTQHLNVREVILPPNTKNVLRWRSCTRVRALMCVRYRVVYSVEQRQQGTTEAK